MRRILSLVALLVVPILSLAQPQLEMHPTSIDFGTMQQHETLSREVTLRNVGDQVLTIHEVDATCGCTVPDLASDTLGPGESTVMEVQFNSQDFQGRQIKYLKITTDDPRQRLVDFLVQAMVKVPLTMKPKKSLIRFPSARVGTSHTVTYTFESDEVDRLEITPSVWPEEWLHIEVKPGADPHSATVDFILRPDSPPGLHREVVKLSTNVPEAAVVSLEADVKVVTDLVMDMDRVNLRVVRPGQELSSRVRVASYEPQTEFVLTDAEVDIPGMRVTIENGDGESFAVLGGEALAMDHPLVTESRGRIKGTLTIHTNLDGTPTLTVPVTYMLRR